MLGADLSFRHDRWLDRLRRSPTDEGTVTGIVVRPASDRRERPASARIEPGRGLVGDLWETDPDREAQAEVSIVNAAMIEALSEGDPDRAARSGDNLWMDLDLSEANLPPGTVLEIGADARLEVTPFPHRPCGAFHERFGPDAVKRVQRAIARGLRGRGVLCRVVAPGEIGVGDRAVVRRPSTGSAPAG